ncbi:MAG: zinc-ribbon domain containing protein [Fibrobacter sp.]|nr:zinc-ribbon domain containing protein [Fibrobacter sp.]
MGIKISNHNQMVNYNNDIKMTDYILNTFATHEVVFDTSAFLGEQMTWKNAILPRLALCNRKYTVPTCVMDELKEKACMVSPTDTAALAQRAKKALVDIDDHIQQGLCEIVDDGLKIGFADGAIYSYFAKNRFNTNLVLITRDIALGRDVLALNDLQSARSYRAIKVWRMEDSGFLNTHYDWNGNAALSFVRYNQGNNHISSFHHEESTPVNEYERICVTCKKSYKLTEAQIANHERGVPLPTHCECCIAAKKAALQIKFPTGRALKPVVVNPPMNKVDDSVEKLTCVDCGEIFDLSASNKRFYILKGLVPPKRCQTCRDRIKNVMGNSSYGERRELYGSF